VRIIESKNQVIEITGQPGWYRISEDRLREMLQYIAWLEKELDIKRLKESK